MTATKYKKDRFSCLSTAEGGLDFGEYNRRLLKETLKAEPNVRWELVRITPESKEQRGFFEGGVIPLATYFHETLDHHINADCKKMRYWLKLEFNGELLEDHGKVHMVPKSTKGKLKGEDGLIDKIIDDIEEQNGKEFRGFVLNTKEYDNWRDSIYPFGGPDNWIDYCISIKKL